MKTARAVCQHCADMIKASKNASAADIARVDRLLAEDRCLFVRDFHGHGIFYFNALAGFRGGNEPGIVPSFCPYTPELAVCQEVEA